jgi:hypothetical protein
LIDAHGAGATKVRIVADGTATKVVAVDRSASRSPAAALSPIPSG